MNLPRLSPDAERALSAATQEAVQLEHAWLGVEHLFLGLHAVGALETGTTFASGLFDVESFAGSLREKVRGGDGGEPSSLAPTPRCREVLELAARTAARSGKTLVEPGHLVEAIFAEGRSVPVRLLRALDVDVNALVESLRRETQKPKATPTPILDQFGRDLTELAQGGQLSPVIGREPEMELLAQVLLRKNKNNPVLVGEAGVGKTAVVEGFAQRLVADDCPEPLRGKRVIELSLGTLVAGTKYRGEFEERLVNIAKEAAAHPEILLFLDEVHTVVGAGSTGGGDSLDASNILKPALARGEIRCIGATTIAEFRAHIEKDPALERRFEKILVDEPSPEEALEILTRLQPSLEAHHQLEIAPEALQAAVHLTVKHVPERNLPDKALDAIDQSCARRRLQRYADAARNEALGQQLVCVGEQDVAHTVSQWTGIPLERISGEAAVSLLSIQDELCARVVGQDEAVRAVARTVITARAGLADPNRPLGVFFFTGPTGVGKTHLAKSLAEVLFGTAKRLVRIDMSEYMEPHSVSNLIGAPPGYVGHEQEGVLISALRTHPHCIVLFDEVEKAHPRVFDLFLQIFDEGRLSGTQGKSADFTQSVVILTSNIDPRPEAKATPIGFGGEAAQEEDADAPDPRDVLLKHLRPELVNRIDEIVAFTPLGDESLRRIIDAYVGEIQSLLADRKLELELEEGVYTWLIEQADAATFGARELQRLVDRQIRQPLAAEILKHGDDVGVVRLRREGDGIAFVALKDEGQMA